MCFCCHESVLNRNVSSSSGGRVRVLVLDDESVALCASSDPMKVLEDAIGVFDQGFRGCEKPKARSPSITEASNAPAIGDCGSRLESTSPIAWLGAGSIRSTVTLSGMPPNIEEKVWGTMLDQPP